MKDRLTALLGICGGIAAYKAVDVASRLRKAGFDVHVAMSDASQHFVQPLTFSGVTGNKVLTTLFPDKIEGQGDDLYPHLYPATRADLFILLPATADMMAKAAVGLGSDVVSTSMLSLTPSCCRIFCPAMNVEMWHQPVVQRNVRALEQEGWLRVGPAAGQLACGMEGYGRMAEPHEIVRSAIEAMDHHGPDLNGKTVLILSGPTREHFDPVRFLGNPSSGKMGKALAEEAARAGAKVEFVSGPVPETNLPASSSVRVHHVTSARDMLERGEALYEVADIVIYAAAVADYRPVDVQSEKMPKLENDLTIRLEATPDIAATLNRRKKKGQVMIGFALQTGEGEEKAREKLANKNFDGILLNNLDALGGDQGRYRYLAAGAESFEDWGKLSKRDCARRILSASLTVGSCSPTEKIY